MPIYIPSDHYWIVVGDETRVFSSARRAYVPAGDAQYLSWLEISGWGGPERIPSEADLWAVLAAQAPECLPDDQKPKRKVAKSLILSRITDAQLEQAMALMTVRQQERWRAPDQPAVYFDDPETIAVLQAIGADPDEVLAP